MPRKRSGREQRRREAQADWGVCIAWRRMYVAVMNAEWDLRIPIASFLVSTQALVDKAKPAFQTQAKRVLRTAWRAFRDDETWAAVVFALRARAIVNGRDKSDQYELEGQQLCKLFRECYATAPPNFERVGRSAEGRAPLL